MSKKVNLDKLFDFLNLEALSDQDKINDIKRLVTEMVWDRSKKNKRFDVFKEHKLQHIVNLISGIKKKDTFGLPYFESVLSEEKQAELREKIVFAANTLGDIIRENGVDYKDKVNESSPYGSTELNFHNWYGFNNRSIVITLPDRKVVLSRNDEFPIGSIMSEAQEAQMRKRGFVVHKSNDKWR